MILDKVKLGQATSAADLEQIRGLFLEYASALEISLCFHNFEAELATLPGKYAPSRGRLLLAQENAEPVGCVALRPLEEGICEMKRLYVRPNWRRKGLGRVLAERIIAAAREIGYGRIRLDTLDSLTPAIALYRSLGFEPIPPYYANPSERVVFMELALDHERF